MKLRRSEDRGYANHGWLEARHTFSFASYYDPGNREHRVLRVMNEDRIQPGQGFGMHPHSDMEIVTYVISGSLEHKDSMGNSSVIRAGNFQRISAGTGVVHSEFNPSNSETTHLYQIWIKPSGQGLPTGYEQRALESFGQSTNLKLVASQSGREESMTIQQDVDIYHAKLDANSSIPFASQKASVWIQVVSGSLTLNDVEMVAGDGAALDENEQIKLTAIEQSQVLIFDLP